MNWTVGLSTTSCDKLMTAKGDPAVKWTRHASLVAGVALAAAGVNPPVHALAGDAIDTRITFTVADDNVTKGPDETATASPTLPNFQPTRQNQLPGDNHEKRDTGFENLTHLVLYADQPGFFAGLDTQAALVLRAELLDARGVALKEDGSYLKLTKQHGPGAWVLTAFPVSADRFRLGYSYEISWGGNDIFLRSKATPGLRLAYQTDTIYGFLGIKTGLLQVDLEDGSKELDTVWGVLAGGGIDLSAALRFETGAGFFYRGTIDKPQLRLPLPSGGFRTAPWQGFGGSAQLAYHVGLPIGTPIDFRLYKNDPLLQESFFQPETYNDALSFQVSGEISALGQTLQDPEVPASTTVQPAGAADLSARIKIGKWRVHGLAVAKTLAFILFNVPSNPSFVDFAQGVKAAPELLGRVGCDYFWEAWHLTPGVIMGAVRPAHRGGNSQAADTLGQQLLVFRSDTDIDVLGPGDRVRPTYFAKLTLKWDLSTLMAAAAELQYSHDPNRRTLAQDPSGINIVRVADDPDVLGFTAMLRARF